MKIVINEAEGNELIKLIDIALKAQGLTSAQSALFFWNKIKLAFEEEKKHESEARLSPKVQKIKES